MRSRIYSLALLTLRELPIAVFFVFAFVAVGSSLLRLQLLDPPPDLIEARRGIAGIATIALASSKTPSEMIKPLLSTPHSQQPATDTPEAPDANIGTAKSPPARFNREPTSPARPSRPNPFADRE